MIVTNFLCDGSLISGNVFARKDHVNYVIFEVRTGYYALATVCINERGGKYRATYVGYVEADKGAALLFQGVKAFCVNTGMPIEIQQRLVEMMTPRKVDAMGNFESFI